MDFSTKEWHRSAPFFSSSHLEYEVSRYLIASSGVPAEAVKAQEVFTEWFLQGKELMSDILNQSAAPHEVLELKPSVMKFLRGAVMDYDLAVLASALRNLPYHMILPDFFRLVNGMLDIAQTPNPDTPLGELSAVDVEACLLRRAMLRPDEDAMLRALHGIQGMFAGLFPTADDAPGFPAPPPEPGEYESAWSGLIGNPSGLAWYCSSRFGMSGTALSEPVLKIIHRIAKLERPFYNARWEAAAIDILSRSWPVVNDLDFVAEKLLTKQPMPVGYSALGVIEAMGKHAVPVEARLTNALGGISPRTSGRPPELESLSTTDERYHECLIWDALTAIADIEDE